MPRDMLIKCLNEWQRRYIADPHAFEADFETYRQFMEAEANGREPDYGEVCTSYLEKLATELQAA